MKGFSSGRNGSTRQTVAENNVARKRNLLDNEIREEQYRRIMTSRLPVWKQSERRKMNNRIRIVAVALAIVPGLFALSTLARKLHLHRAPERITVPHGWIGCQAFNGAAWLEEGGICHENPAERAPDYINLAPGKLSAKPQEQLQLQCVSGCVDLSDVPQAKCPERRGCA